ncbi:cytochrome c(L), periplasmic [Granulibacter bethesdensis]|uniref:Cytochrome c-L n=1 Tax=Granulibacter bethesdensis (strain ATCC BAA-1260 / CGDNIH1) TaxID=391165 RepID=Q0BVA8_GRABC|nr:cytochrome c(L), periplasmic [Granulibacter bethesdensis]ABI61244.1 Cytochrome c-L precursor [Granulibacter bethesdensis CGDNIH1]AHJ64738.1 Cytochrome c-L precursor [Granulibacter bethesdensis CGDNIH4]AHJ67353.1 Cytochrome c-L precursor [Granulibacter bethesdensis]APH51030.1 Cytochrome c-L precursor [Granulibacter bethesdensis]APH58654.1 Cytochrome c-L precursor [Granulibacter bethesdensis]
MTFKYILNGTLAASLFAAAFAVSVPAHAGDTPVPPSALKFTNTVSGDPLDLNDSLPDGRDTPAVKQFLQTGHNPYNLIESCLPNGKSLWLSACSGCHGGEMEGKVGPSLADDYWTYETNKTDQGLFSTIFGGANGMMGPHNQDLTMDQILRVMAWIRFHYEGPKHTDEDMPWLTDAQRKSFKLFKKEDEAKFPASEDAKACKLPG